jgi:hypothetical protein
MPVSRASEITRDLLVRPRFLLLTAAVTLAALLACTGTASAETFAGESTTKIGETDDELPGGAEVDIVKGSASYDTSGSVSIVVTTAGPPQPLVPGVVPPEKNETSLFSILAHTGPGQCTQQILLGQNFPFVGLSTVYSEPGVKGAVGLSAGSGEALPATKEVAGDTTTLRLASGAVANLGLSCALIEVGNGAGASTMVFPLKLVVPPAPPAAPPAPPAPAPPPPPAKLAITRPKPVQLTVGKWKTVKVTVANPGGSTLSGGTLRVKPAKGVYLKPETQKLPVLAPGDSFALSVRVELTKQAKKKTILSLVASGEGGISDTNSLVVKTAPKG